jgi:hypothetical protein
MGLITASSVLHEIDIVARSGPCFGILELKNRAGWPPEKNDAIVFFAKILDYLCSYPVLLRSHLVPIFVSSFAFDLSGLAACLGLGIHPIAPELRPLPILLDNATRMGIEIERGLRLSPPDIGAFDDFRAKLETVSNSLAGADANNRFDSYDDFTLAVRNFGEVGTRELVEELYALNSECAGLVKIFKAAKEI